MPTQATEGVRQMPTGVPLRDVREQLFAAAVRVLLRDGPSAVTSRAVTTEAGVAKGILHRHFADFDTFLASLVLTHVERLEDLSADLRASAGTGAVEENLARALLAALDREALGLVALACARRELLDRLRLTTPTGVPLLAETTRMITGYLTAERGLGRIALDADVDRLAPIVVGAVHLLCAGRDVGLPETREVRDLVAAVVAARRASRPNPRLRR